MTSLKRDIREIGADRAWIVFGPAGAASWNLRNIENRSRDYGIVSLHSPRPLLPSWPTPSPACRLMEVPCFDGGSVIAGGRLGERWDAAGRDDEVIWAELESWYASRLASLAVTS